MNTVRSRFVVEFASQADDAELRALLRNNPVGKNISLSYEREPSVFIASDVEGDSHYFTAARYSDSGKIVGMGGCSFYQAFVNGENVKVGYLSQLRVAEQSRGTVSILIKGFKLMSKAAAEQSANFFVTTIIADNAVAQRFLASPKKGFPVYSNIGRLHSLALPLWRTPKSAMRAWSGTVRTGVDSDKPRIVDFLAKESQKFQFAPLYSSDVLWNQTRSRGLSVSDFLLAEDAGEIVGCLALWDQSLFKQIVVRDYGTFLRHGRCFVNMFAPLLGNVCLPPVGAAFAHVYFSHVFARDCNVMRRLVAEGIEIARSRGFSYAALGLSAQHPALSLIRKEFKHHNYESIIYTVHNGEKAETPRLDPERVPYLEIARL